MTNEQYTEELLIKSHSLGIREQVFELSKKFQEKDRTLDMHGSIQKAYEQLTK